MGMFFHSVCLCLSVWRYHKLSLHVNFVRPWYSRKSGTLMKPSFCLNLRFVKTLMFLCSYTNITTLMFFAVGVVLALSCSCGVGLLLSSLSTKRSFAHCFCILRKVGGIDLSRRSLGLLSSFVLGLWMVRALILFVNTLSLLFVLSLLLLLLSLFVLSLFRCLLLYLLAVFELCIFSLLMWCLSISPFSPVFHSISLPPPRPKGLGE